MAADRHIDRERDVARRRFHRIGQPWPVQDQRRSGRQQAGRAIASDPSNAYGYYLAGQAALGVQDFADLDSLFRRAVELCPDLGPYDVDRLRRGSAGLSVERGSALIQSGDTTGGSA